MTTAASAITDRPMLFCVLVLVALTMGYGAYLAVDIATRLPNPQALSSIGQMPEATVVYDASDRPAFMIFREQRVLVPLERLSPHLVDAVLAIEDRRFYEHGGIDLVRVAGAAVANLTAGRIVEGGSTITQQLARQSLLSTERTIGRKVAELVTASWIERVYDKHEILEQYLNRIYFGAGFYGAEAAARGYFGKPAEDLSVAEAALLAGLIRAPEGYSPVESPERALARRNVVLDVLLETGVIDGQVHQDARELPLAIQSDIRTAERYGSYFKEEVRRQVVAMFGWEAVYEQGLRVYTTIDPAVQRAAEAAVEAGAQRIEARPGYSHRRRQDEAPAKTTAAPDYLQGAFIALDPRTGEVRALVGGRDFSASPFNRATQARRQPGSAFKPILYATALDQGMTPATVLDHLDDPVQTVGGVWLPADGSDEYSALTLRTGLQLSSNRAAVRLLSLTGIDRTVEYAVRFGLQGQPRVPSVALGAGSATLEELTAAYAAFANQGVVPEPTYIRRVTDADGVVLFAADGRDTAARPAAVSPATAFLMADLLRGVVDAGTGARVRREGFTAPAAGKTGTTNDYKDAWFIGFTPTLAAGVWLGFDEPRTIVPRGYASDLAAPVWAHVMRQVGARDRDTWLQSPPDVVAVEICPLSGAVATDACRREHGASTYVELFAHGTEPVEYCPLHRDRSLLARLTAPFRGPDESDDAPPVPEESASTATASRVDAAATTALPSVEVIHDHIFGNCAGRIVAGPDGLQYVTSHKDAFGLALDDLVRVRVDVARGRLHIATHQGRVYNFETTAPDRAALATLTDVLRVR